MFAVCIGRIFSGHGKADSGNGEDDGCELHGGLQKNSGERSRSR